MACPLSRERCTPCYRFRPSRARRSSAAAACCGRSRTEVPVDFPIGVGLDGPLKLMAAHLRLESRERRSNALRIGGVEDELPHPACRDGEHLNGVAGGLENGRKEV